MRPSFRKFVTLRKGKSPNLLIRLTRPFFLTTPWGSSRNFGMTQPGVSSSSHLDRKTLKKPDAITKTLKSWVERLFGNRKVVLIAGSATAVVLIGASLWISQRQKHEVAAAAELFQAEQAMEKEFTELTKDLAPQAPSAANKKAKTKAPPAPTDADPVAAYRYKALDVDGTFKSVALYRKAYETYPTTSAGHRARVTLAKLYWDHGEKEKALAQYQAAVTGAPTNLDKAKALLAVGLVQESLKKFPDAIATFQSLALLQDTHLKDLALLALARNYELSGDTEKAKATYGQIQKDHPDTDSAKTAAARLAVLK